MVFNQGMVAYGYGDIYQTPIVSNPLLDGEVDQLTVMAQLYMLQYFTPDILGSFTRIRPGYVIGVFPS